MHGFILAGLIIGSFLLAFWIGRDATRADVDLYGWDEAEVVDGDWEEIERMQTMSLDDFLDSVFGVDPVSVIEDDELDDTDLVELLMLAERFGMIMAQDDALPSYLSLVEDDAPLSSLHEYNTWSTDELLEHYRLIPWLGPDHDPDAINTALIRRGVIADLIPFGYSI